MRVWTDYSLFFISLCHIILGCIPGCYLLWVSNEPLTVFLTKVPRQRGPKSILLGETSTQDFTDSPTKSTSRSWGLGISNEWDVVKNGKVDERGRWSMVNCPWYPYVFICFLRFLMYIISLVKKISNGDSVRPLTRVKIK